MYICIYTCICVYRFGNLDSVLGCEGDQPRVLPGRHPGGPLALILA